MSRLLAASMYFPLMFCEMMVMHCACAWSCVSLSDRLVVLSCVLAWFCFMALEMTTVIQCELLMLTGRIKELTSLFLKNCYIYVCSFFPASSLIGIHFS